MKLGTWMHLYDEDATLEGWSLFECCGAKGHDPVEIQRIDESDRFEFDDDAWVFVVEQALGDLAAGRTETAPVQALRCLVVEGCLDHLADVVTAWAAARDHSAAPAADVSVYEESHVDPVYRIEVVTNGEADRPYRLYEILTPGREWVVRIELRVPGAFDAQISGAHRHLAEGRVYFTERSENGGPVGPVRSVHLSAIRRITVY